MKAIEGLPARQEQADERRRQMVRIANDLIEEAGIDAVTLARVTERAGCARTLVYRYFASREELLVAVLRDYFERLDARMPQKAQRAVLTTVLAHIDRLSAAETKALGELVSLLWDVQIAAGLGGAVLRASPHPSPQIQALVRQSRRSFERRVTDPLRKAGLSAVEAQVAVDSLIASFVSLALQWKAGKVGREEAIGIHTRATLGLIRGLLAGRPRAENRRG